MKCLPLTSSEKITLKIIKYFAKIFSPNTCIDYYLFYNMPCISYCVPNQNRSPIKYHFFWIKSSLFSISSWFNYSTIYCTLWTAEIIVLKVHQCSILCKSMLFLITLSTLFFCSVKLTVSGITGYEASTVEKLAVYFQLMSKSIPFCTLCG